MLEGTQQIENSRSRYFYLDVLRVIAVALVVYGHIVSVGTFAPSIPDIGYSGGVPLLPLNNYYMFDHYLAKWFGGVLSGDLGVVMFFMATGFLMPMMMEKYPRRDFLVNRFFRIFPTFWAASLVVAAVLMVTSPLVFDLGDIADDAQIMWKTKIIRGVAWTLRIEIYFYLLMAVVGRLDIRKLLCLQAAFLALFFFFGKVSGAHWAGLSGFMRFVPVIFLGSSLWLAEKMKNKWAKAALVLFSLGVVMAAARISQMHFAEKTSYTSVWAYVLALAVWFGLRFFPAGVASEKVSLLFWGGVRGLADLVYPIYLTHVTVGLSVMWRLQGKGMSAAAMIWFSIAACIVVARLIYLYAERPAIKLGKKCLERLRGK
jgi:peptidoglycan/LPS O-acetylase OafA/YrhL